MTIKKISRPCWIVECDECGNDVFGYDDFDNHFPTKKSLLERMEEDDLGTEKKKHFCDSTCQGQYFKKRSLK